MSNMAAKSEVVTSASMFNAVMTSVKFNEKNYVYWAKSVECL